VMILVKAGISFVGDREKVDWFWFVGA
jgi:hypothetical protein